MKSFQCNQCQATFTKSYNLTSHLKLHSNIRPYNCPQCPSAFRRRNALQRHLLVHGLLVSNFKCKICDKFLYSKKLLVDHERTHTGVRPFQCQILNCNSAFLSQAALSNHNRIQHCTALGLKQFKCTYCDKVFGFQSLWDHHMKVQHSDEKPFKCDYESEGCTRAFKIKRELIKHLRVHTGETPYVCDECGRAYAQQWALTKHIRTHREKVKCQVCPRYFLNKLRMKEHFFKCHEIKE